jgi:hypothetical protein
MLAAPHSNPLRRRQVLLAGAALSLPLPAFAALVYTPHELMEQYAREVTPRLHLPADEVALYGSIAELQLCSTGRELLAPQYLLVIDRNPHVQAAFLFWRLLPGSYELVGASPVAAGANPLDAVRQSQELLVQIDANGARRGRSRVYEFGSAAPQAEPASAALRVQVRAAPAGAEGRLGTPCPDGCILLPASLVAFLDEYGVLDHDTPQRTQRHVLPCRGSHLLLVDSERDERPAWSPAPAGERRMARARRPGAA